MCGRFYVLMEVDGAEEREVFPTDEVRVLTREGWQWMSWGFPKFTGSGVIINARSETVAEKPMFSGSFATQRCLVPSAGFFEWQHEDGKKKTKERYRVYRKDGKPLMMAGIYNEQGQFVILTRQPNAVVAPLHDRMPVAFASAEMQDLWLHEDGLAELLLRMQPDEPTAARADDVKMRPWREKESSTEPYGFLPEGV